MVFWKDIRKLSDSHDHALTSRHAHNDQLSSPWPVSNSKAAHHCPYTYVLNDDDGIMMKQAIEVFMGI